MSESGERLDDPWGDGRLHLVLGYAFEAFGKGNRVDANRVAEQLHVSPSTVRRWVRQALPGGRRDAIAERILPPAPAIEHESREYRYALKALRDIYGQGVPPLKVWKDDGWLEPHVLAVVKLGHLGVCVPRIGIADGDRKTQARLRADRGVIVDQGVFPNRFAAQVAKGQILEDTARWRVVLPHDYLSRGRTEAWLADSPRKLVSWYVENAPMKPPAKRAPRRARTK